MKKNLLILIVAFFALSINAQNLLVNPGFETWASGKPTVWSITNSTYLSQNKSNFTEGTTSCKVNTEQANQNITFSQNVAVTAGKTYTFSVSYFIERGDGTDARISCYFKNSANKAIKMSLEDSLALKGPGGNSAYFPTELGVWKTYTCDVVAPVGATVFVFSVRSSAYSNVSWDNFSFSVNTKPTLYVSKTELIDFNYAPGSGPSAEKTFVVKGSNLTSSITVTAPLNYEISTSSGSLFVANKTIIIPQTNGLVNSVTIYTRLKSNLSTNIYTGDITVVSTGATSQNISLTGTVGSPPVLINSSVLSLSGFTYNEGYGPSGIKSFTVSGSGLLNGLTISAPEGYEISIFSGLSFLGSNTFTISQSGGNVTTTTIYTRLKAGLTAASYIGNINLTSGTTTKTIPLTGAVNSIPEMSISTTTLSGFRYEPGNGPSAEQSFTASGKGMTTALIISAPTGYEISTETGSSFSGASQLVLTQTGGIINPTLIYVRLKANLSEAAYSGNLTLQTSGGITKSISLSGIVSVPQEITVSTDILSDFCYKSGAGPSAEKAFTLSAKGLTSLLIVSAPVNFEISTESGSSFTSNNQLILPLNVGSIATTTVYVRLKAGLAESDSYTGNLVLSSGSDLSKNIALSGYVTGLSEINVSTPTISGFSYWVGNGPSNQQSFTVSANGLLSDLTINAPAGFELSNNEGSNFSGSNSLQLSQLNGKVLSTTIYVRLVAGLGVNTYLGQVGVSSNGIASKYISLNGNVLLSTNISGANSNQVKVYSNSKNIIVQGVEKNETVELFSFSGKLLQVVKSTGETLELPVQDNSVYIVRINSKAYKVVL